MQNCEDAFDEAIKQMPKDFQIREYILVHREEVKRMLLTEYNEEEEKELLRENLSRIIREEAEAEGRAKGEAEGRAEGRAEGQKDMLMNNIRTLMNKMQITAEEAMNMLDIPEDKQDEYKAML